MSMLAHVAQAHCYSMPRKAWFPKFILVKCIGAILEKIIGNHAMGEGSEIGWVVSCVD